MTSLLEVPIQIRSISSPPIEPMPTRSSAPDCKADDPHEKEECRDDPEEMRGETHASEEQNDQKYEQDQHCLAVLLYEE
jgi:hypothetical protein